MQLSGMLGLLAGFLLLDVAPTDPVTNYQTVIKPLLAERCIACHGALKQEGGLRLDTATLATRGGDSGPVVIAGDPDASPLIDRISTGDMSIRMPPEGEPLTKAQIAQLRDWILRDAVGPADERPEADPRDHWAFRTPRKPAVPQVTTLGWQENPIDAFLAHAHLQHGLTTQRPADRRLWLRRVSLDLTGLPPTVDQQAAFLADNSPNACERVVDRLLDSPQYGERWGRHWMDIWRYSDWWGLGAEVRSSQKHIWHWRDWIVESCNADMGYDQMLRDMLAADELAPTDLNRIRATGFLARQYFKFNRTTWLDGVVEHTSKAFLGLTTNCAKCHDHKYDPISQQEYYQFRAIFEPYQLRTEFMAGELDPEKIGIPRAFDCNLDARTFLHIRGDDRRPDESLPIVPGIPQVLREIPFDVKALTLPPEAHQPGLKESIVTAHRQSAQQQLANAEKGVTTALQQLAETEEAAQRALADVPQESPWTVDENFSEERPNLWQIREGSWSYANSRLRQEQTGAKRTALRYLTLPPANFEATLRFVTTGGDRWKSVGITFDVTAEGHEVLAYLSAVDGGAKAQISYMVNGNHAYPATAAQPRKVALNEIHELTLRVRDTLVNLDIDGEPSVAYRLPIARRPGHLELITFDAQAEFVSFQLRPLSNTQVLREPATDGNKGKGGEAPWSVEQARLAVTLAQAKLATAKAQLESIVARAAADRVRFVDSNATDADQTIAAAVRAEHQARLAQAREDVLKAELELLRSNDAQRDAAEKKLKQQQAMLKGIPESPPDKAEYTSLPGALKTLESNVESAESRNRPFPRESTGRRSALAHWLTDPRHPLTARVAVNHIWTRHMGRPLVATVFDFGRKGAAPTHPELLDWLAVEFMENGWSMKHLHRLIVTSQAYRLSSSNAHAEPQTLATDPENKYYWRSHPLRMEAQVVRDSLLHLAGELDLTLGGPSIPVNAESNRRSLYYVHSHNDHQPFLAMFDDANVLDCYRRAESIVPQQALALENSELAAKMAAKISARISESATLTDDEFIRLAFLTVLATEPTSEELELVGETLHQLVAVAQRANRPQPEQHARGLVVLALLNHNDFITIR